MNKKASQFLGKVWKMTAFSIFSEPGKKQSQLIQQSFESIFKAFNIFEKSISSAVNELRSQKLNIPALIKVRQDILKYKPKIQKFVEIETSSMEIILNQLTQFRFLLQKSQKNSICEYEEKISSFLIGKEENSVSMRKMEKVHEEFMNLKYDYKVRIRDNKSSSSFEKWLADFHIRAEDYFMKSYSYDWQQEMREIVQPFVPIRKQSQFKSKVFDAQYEGNKEEHEIEIENKQEQFEILYEKQSELKNYGKLREPFEMQEDQNDIVGQIYKEFESSIA